MRLAGSRPEGGHRLEDLEAEGAGIVIGPGIRIGQAGLRLRVLRSTDYLDHSHDPLIQESRELISIVSTIVRNNARNEAANNPDDQ